jgi:ABC-type antimicrobial peptide transport system permease subunit
MHIKLKPGNISDAIASLEDTWKRINPDFPFEYHFLDENYEALYKSEQRLSSILNYFTFIGIFVSCLGLIGLASYTAERRTKEIGIRKVLGASVMNIIRILSSEFLFLVIVSNIFAWPTAYYFLNLYLENFAYRININWNLFSIAGLLTLVIAMLTVCFQAVRAAVINPVDSLRNE